MVRLVKVGKAVKPVRVRCGRDLVHFTGLLRVTWAAPGTLHRAA